MKFFQNASMFGQIRLQETTDERRGSSSSSFYLHLILQLFHQIESFANVSIVRVDVVVDHLVQLVHSFVDRIRQFADGFLNFLDEFDGEIDFDRMNVLLDQPAKPIVNVDQFVFEFLLDFHPLFAFVSRLFARSNERLQTFAARFDTLFQLVGGVRRKILAKTIGQLGQLLQLMFRLLESIEQSLNERDERSDLAQKRSKEHTW